MRILAIDPGPVKSSFCYYDGDKKTPIRFFTLENEKWKSIDQSDFIPDKVVIEIIASYGMPVGKTVFETCVWIGRFVERIIYSYFLQTDKHDFITRQDVKLHLCGQVRAKDANVIQALKDRFGEKGTKKKPGVLYGIKKDEWQALAIAVTYAETRCK